MSHMYFVYCTFLKIICIICISISINYTVYVSLASSWPPGSGAALVPLGHCNFDSRGGLPLLCVSHRGSAARSQLKSGS